MLFRAKLGGWAFVSVCACLGCEPADSEPAPAASHTDGGASLPAERPSAAGGHNVSGGPVVSRWDAVPAKPGELFTEVTAQVGLDFVHQCGHRDRYLLPEIQGGGAAVFDYDNDGDEDIYLINSGNVPPFGKGEITASNRLYRQDADGGFTDVTRESGLGDTGYGMGCTVGDIDNDGDTDVYVTNLGLDKLYRNNGDGTFTDITVEAGINNERWSTSAAFGDFDRDGFLDLFVTNYVVFDPDADCRDGAGRPDFCGPKAYVNEPDILYHNDGGLHFTDISEEAGIASARYAGLGVVCVDITDDGWMDIYVANDADPNSLWINRGDGTFIDEAIVLGAAFNQHGVPEAGMGVAVGDVDSDGDLDLFVTHLTGETNTYYRNLGAFGFDDVTAAVNLGAASVGYTGFGTALFDFDNDGALDIAVVNGGVKRRSRALASRPPFFKDYAEPNLLFRNDGSGTFEDVSDRAPSYSGRVEMSRGLIPADFDRDGDLDLLLTNIEGAARLYRNNDTHEHNWLDIRAVLRHSGREAVGAKVIVVTGERSFVRHAVPPGGYLTGAKASIHLGLGRASRVERIEVRWPDGRWERFGGPPLRRTITLRQGSGDPMDE